MSSILINRIFIFTSSPFPNWKNDLWFHRTWAFISFAEMLTTCDVRVWFLEGYLKGYIQMCIRLNVFSPFWILSIWSISSHWYVCGCDVGASVSFLDLFIRFYLFTSLFFYVDRYIFIYVLTKLTGSWIYSIFKKGYMWSIIGNLYKYLLFVVGDGWEFSEYCF